MKKIVKTTEQDLKNINELYNNVMTAVNDGIWDWNTQTGNAFFSSSYYVMLGYKNNEFIANYENWRKLVHQDDLQRVEKELQESIISGNTFKIDLRMKTKKGEWMWVTTRGKAIEKDADGKSKRMVGTLTDITVQKKLEDKIKESEQRFRAIFEGSADAIMTLEPPLWKFTSGNISTIKMFGAKDEAEFCSAEPWKLSPEKQSDGQLSSKKAREMIDSAMRDGTKSFEWTHCRLNGENFPADVLLTKIIFGGTDFLQATIRDMSEVRKAQEVLKQNLNEVEKTNDVLVGREVKMIELKKEIDVLKKRILELESIKK